MTQQELIQQLTKKDGRCFISRNDKKYAPILLEMTKDLDQSYSLKERLEILRIGYIPHCETCGGMVHWDTSSTRWSRFCSIKCCNSNPTLNAIKVENRDQEQIWEKVRTKCLERYGVANPMHSDEFKQKVRVSCGGLLGGANPIIREKMEQTCLERYGQRVPKMSRISKPHQMLLQWFEQNQIETFINTFNILGDREIDIYIPSKNLAIEVNGIYWHSELKLKDKWYHEKKYQDCEKQGIKLLQFWDNEILNKFHLVTSMISSHCGMNARLGARKCSILELKAEDTFHWLEENHIQGGIRKRSHALISDNELVACMVLSNGVLERFASLKRLTVQGGMSRLLDSYDIASVKTFSDNRYSNGQVYKNLGFECINPSTGLKYGYTRDFKSIEPRWKFMKKHIAHWGDINTETEYEIMTRQGYVRIWGCSGKTWLLTK